MPLGRWLRDATLAPGAPGLRRVELDAAHWRDFAKDSAAAGGRLLALWGTAAPAVHMIVLLQDGAVLATGSAGPVGAKERVTRLRVVQRTHVPIDIVSDEEPHPADLAGKGCCLRQPC